MTPARDFTDVHKPLSAEVDGLTVPLILHWCSTTPALITMDIHTGAPRPVQWEFDRLLLADGLHGPVGEGDVRITPNGAHLDIALIDKHTQVDKHTQQPAAHLLVDRDEVAQFIDRTVAVAALDEIGAVVPDCVPAKWLEEDL